MKKLKSNLKVLTKEQLKTVLGEQKAPAAVANFNCQDSCNSLGFFIGQMRNQICYCY
ncbi:hypothetical protein ACL0VS_17975 [Chryseobacterium sp. PMSZPI]|uniref:hypothetical protein n=1 Tax=Chryseobacterium sp. PMSZPI TaxID=1033900 RepID=UPI0039A1B05D